MFYPYLSLRILPNGMPLPGVCWSYEEAIFEFPPGNSPFGLALFLGL